MKMKEKTREELLEQLADIRFGIISLTGFYSMLSLSDNPFGDKKADKAARNLKKNAPFAFKDLKDLEKETMSQLREYDKAHGIISKWGGEMR